MNNNHPKKNKRGSLLTYSTASLEYRFSTRKTCNLTAGKQLRGGRNGFESEEFIGEEKKKRKQKKTITQKNRTQDAVVDVGGDSTLTGKVRGIWISKVISITKLCIRRMQQIMVQNFSWERCLRLSIRPSLMKVKNQKRNIFYLITIIIFEVLLTSSITFLCRWKLTTFIILWLNKFIFLFIE